jgi:hypothetical protein
MLAKRTAFKKEGFADISKVLRIVDLPPRLLRSLPLLIRGGES